MFCNNFVGFINPISKFSVFKIQLVTPKWKQHFQCTLSNNLVVKFITLSFDEKKWKKNRAKLTFQKQFTKHIPNTSKSDLKALNNKYFCYCSTYTESQVPWVTILIWKMLLCMYVYGLLSINKCSEFVLFWFDFEVNKMWTSHTISIFLDKNWTTKEHRPGQYYIN